MVPGLLHLTGIDRPVHLTVNKSRSGSVRRGHPWIWRDWLAPGKGQEQLPQAPPGAFALLKDTQGQILAKGFYDAECPIAFRVCALK